MSQQDGVSSVASIEAAPPNHGTETTTTTITTTPSTPSSLTRISSSTEPPLKSISRPSGAISSRIQIPKLSAATTELLARVVGNIRGTQHQQQLKNEQSSISWSPSPFNSDLNNRSITNSQVACTMRASSTLIELPTAPFVYSNRRETPAATPNLASAPQPTSRIRVNSAGFVDIAPKPAVARSTSTSTPTPTPVDSQGPNKTKIQPPSQPQPRPLLPATTVTTDIKQPAAASTAKSLKPASTSRQRRGAGNGKKRSRKRKRGDGSDDEVIRAGDSSSDESDITPTATQTKSGRQVNRPSLYVPPPSSPAVLTKESSNASGGSDKPQEPARKRRRVFRKGKDANNITCVYCQRGHSPPSNTIVFCDECNRAWHQHCHDPPIENDVITVKEKEWLCRECKPVDITILHPTVVRSNPSLTSRTVRPPVHAPLTLPKTEVGGERFSADERRRFLTGLSHATLVELLLTISDQQPTVPMFPENLKSLPSSRFPFTPPVATTTTATATLTPSPSVTAHGPGPSYSVNLASTPVVEGTDKPEVEAVEERPRKKRHYYEESDEESEYEFQEHRLYPRAGNGVRLSTNPDDLDILREDPACPTFSYALHAPAQTALN